MKLPQLPGGNQTLRGRMKERWELLLENELEKMESHRQALLDVLHVRSQDPSDEVAQEIPKSQPGLR